MRKETTFCIGDNYCEWTYLHELCGQLDYDIIVTDNLETLPRYGDVIVIVTSDEQCRIPAYHTDVKAIFKHYVLQNNQIKNLFPIPLGYVQGFPIREPIPFNKRTIDVFFIGQITKTFRTLYEDRSSMMKWVRVLKQKKPHLHIEASFTKRFRAGLPIGEYATKLYNSRVVLCPAGCWGPETFRFFEAHIADCNIIAIRQKANWISECSPAYQLSEWSELPNVVDGMLSKSTHTRRIYDSFYSPHAVAMYIRKIVESI